RHTRLVSDWSSDVCSSDLRGAVSISAWELVDVHRVEREPDELRLIRLRVTALLQLLHHRFEPLDVLLIEADRHHLVVLGLRLGRSEERRVGNDCRGRGGAY